jgi:hypothetical protein
MLGTIGDDPLLAVIHFAVLIAITLVGALAALRTFDRRLVAG